jgi:hypothetical protein
MADLARGREIFLQRVEYPLPAKSGVKDYVVYFVDDVGYGAGAREFMGRWYKKHVPIVAKSLEEMFTTLQAEIASGNVTQIRDLVLVAHGNAVQLFIPVVTAAAGTDPVYRCVTEYSLSQLQDDMKAGKFASMKQARKDVAAHMLVDSWVTIRACNIGRSAKVLYALHALFGGRANVYGPSLYMFFGHCYVGPGQRVPTKFAVYDYLVKEHFLPTSEHTLDRQASIISDLLDPESYSMPFELASVQRIGGDPVAIAAYGDRVNELNALHLSDTMRGLFQAKGFPLSPTASVARSTRFTNSNAPIRSAWFIRDRTVESDGAEYDLVYEIHDGTSGDEVHVDTLDARARIASLISSNASFPFQLLFDQDDDDLFKGIVARLAGYADGGIGANADQKAEFTAIEALLNAGQWTNSTFDLAQQINGRLVGAGLEPLADPPPQIQPVPGSGKGSWRIGGAQPLVIKREASKTIDGFPAFSITVYRSLTDKQRVDAEHDVYTNRGRVPDSPGTELAAYLDRFTMDELDGLLAFLRATYRPAFAYYVRHTQQAMMRKREFITWHASHMGNAVLDDYTMPRPGENSDLNVVAFPFEFDDNWREVTASSKYVVPVQSDRWEEDPPLRTALSVDGTWICDSSVPDSPHSSRADARAAQLPGHERYFAHTPDKSLWEPPTPRRADDCADFRTAMEKYKELRDGGMEPELEKLKLEELEIGGESYYKKIQETLEPIHIGTEVVEALFDKKIEPYAKLAEWVGEKLIHHGFEALGEAFEIGAAVGSISLVFTIPFEMWMHAVEANLEGVNNSEAIGEVAAIRLWVHKLQNLTVSQVPFVDTSSIDLGGADTAMQNYLDLKASEHPFDNVRYVYAPDDLVRGYVFAAEKFAAIGPQIVVQADIAVSERIAEIGLSPCKIKVLTDVGLFDLDKIRRKQISIFCDAVLESLPPL